MVSIPMLTVFVIFLAVMGALVRPVRKFAHGVAWPLAVFLGLCAFMSRESVNAQKMQQERHRAYQIQVRQQQNHQQRLLQK